LKNLSILILNYNSSEKVISQLESLTNQGLDKNIFLVIDNNSLDGKPLEEYCLNNNFRFLQTFENKGYAYGNNLAIKKELANNKEYFLILNPDIEIDFLTINTLYEKISSQLQIGAIGCRICDKFQRDLIYSDGGLLFPEFGFRGDHVNNNKFIKEVTILEVNREFDYVNGSVFMFSKEALKQNGFMREDFFMYYEESEWCYRLNIRTNLEMVILTNVNAYHENSIKGKLYHYYMARNRIWFCKLYDSNLEIAKKEIKKEMKRFLFSKRNKTYLKFGLFFSVLKGYYAGLNQEVEFNNFDKLT